jgi:hypothetical protein
VADEPEVQQQYAEHEIVGVFRDQQTASSVARRIVGLGVSPSDVRVGDRAADVLALRAEMREEADNTIVGPGPVGPFTKEMTKGIVALVVLGGIVGGLVCLPLGLLHFAGLSLAARLVIAGLVGVFTGSTVGFMVGGGLGAKGPDVPLAAERGVTVAVRVRDDLAASVARPMRDASPIRLDLGSIEGNPVETLATEEDLARGSSASHSSSSPSVRRPR